MVCLDSSLRHQNPREQQKKGENAFCNSLKNLLEQLALSTQYLAVERSEFETQNSDTYRYEIVLFNYLLFLVPISYLDKQKQCTNFYVHAALTGHILKKCLESESECRFRVLTFDCR